MVLLELPGRQQALHVLSLFAKSGELRFSEVVKGTDLHDAEVNRQIAYLKEHHLIRSRGKEHGARTILVYSITARGKAAWESLAEYARAIQARKDVLGQQEVDVVRAALS